MLRDISKTLRRVGALYLELSVACATIANALDAFERDDNGCGPDCFACAVFREQDEATAPPDPFAGIDVDNAPGNVLEDIMRKATM